MPYAWAWALGNGALILIAELVLLISVAFFILADRKVWAAVGMRRGPNVVGAFGLLQTIADAFKFLLKEVIIPSGSNKVVFLLAPIVTATLAFAGWAVIPIARGWVAADINVGILYLFAMSSLGVYGIIMAGWASNSKYPFLSALRAAAQMVSYEVSIGFVIITVLLFAGSLNLSAIVRAQEHGWFVFSILFPMLPIFFVSALAETNRPPFDLVEAESELVAGFFVEYSATPFLLFFLGEYVSVILMCAMCTILFFGGWLPPLFWPLSSISIIAAGLNSVPGVVWFLIKLLFFFFLFAMA
ncbi:MAG: NADH-quinone oxidoreductase subunit H, partial [Alphaproteobacteria bacterium]|nr:NADH-quinone oxidoreductase subunit H [Alphaproteobacteria bacterium]